MIYSDFLRLLARTWLGNLNPTRYVRFYHDGGTSSEGGFATSTANGAGYGFAPSGSETSAAYGGLSTGTNAAGAIADRTSPNAFNSANGELYFRLFGR